MVEHKAKKAMILLHSPCFTLACSWQWLQFLVANSSDCCNKCWMFEVITLASGSDGNATLVRNETATFLIDAGLSARQLTARLLATGISPEQLSGILLTHEHGDHTSALKVLLMRHQLPVFCNSLTARALHDAGLVHENWKLFQTGSEFSLGSFTIRAFSVPHDAADPVGFRISSSGSCFGVLTDLGYATRLVFEMLRGIQALLIETNHDEELLQKDARRPWSVKQRILSRHGHLSNAAAARVLSELEAPLQHIIIGHLSRDCNSPQLALDSVARALAIAGCSAQASVHCAGQDAPSPALLIT
ncbi:MAG: MBL fold metallo-hydrolase [Terrimicrobiaceae bacterium]